jgi:hypothetical protein
MGRPGRTSDVDPAMPFMRESMNSRKSILWIVICSMLACLLAACGSADQPGATATTEDLWIVFPESRAEEMRIGAWLSSEADYGNFFCTDSGMNWTYEWIFIVDGGDCYFQLQFDVESSTFTELTVNGEA